MLCSSDEPGNKFWAHVISLKGEAAATVLHLFILHAEDYVPGWIVQEVAYHCLYSSASYKMTTISGNKDKWEDSF